MINKNNLTKETALPFIYHSYDTYDWQTAPYGSMVIDPVNGDVGIKLRHNPDSPDPKDPFSKYGPGWVAVKIQSDVTPIIEENSRYIVETFTFKYIDDVTGVMHYTTDSGDHETKLTHMDNLVFKLEKGEYIPGNHHIKACINNSIDLKPSTKTLKEIDGKTFAINRADVHEGCEINVYYIERYKVKSSYSRIFNQTTEPENPEPGDIWINTHVDENLKQDLPLEVLVRYDYDNMEAILLIKTVPYSRLVATLNSNDYVITDRSRTWNTYKLPLLSNVDQVLKITGINEKFKTNTANKELLRFNIVDFNLVDKEIAEETIIYYFSGLSDLNLKLQSAAYISNPNLEQYEPGKYKITLPRKQSEYSFSVIAKKANFNKKEIKNIVVDKLVSPILNVKIVGHSLNKDNLNDQYALIKVKAFFSLEDCAIKLSSNYTVITNFVSKDNDIYTFKVPLGVSTQYLTATGYSYSGRHVVSNIETITLPAKDLEETIVSFQKAGNRDIKGKNYHLINFTVTTENPDIQITSPYPYRIVRASRGVYTYGFLNNGLNYPISFTAGSSQTKSYTIKVDIP